MNDSRLTCVWNMGKLNRILLLLLLNLIVEEIPPQAQVWEGPKITTEKNSYSLLPLFWGGSEGLENFSLHPLVRFILGPWSKCIRFSNLTKTPLFKPLLIWQNILKFKSLKTITQLFKLMWQMLKGPGLFYWSFLYGSSKIVPIGGHIICFFKLKRVLAKKVEN